MASALKGLKIDVGFSSTLDRSKRTLKLISDKLDFPCFEIESFKEIDFGKCTGLNNSQIKNKFPDLIVEWKKNSDPPFPEGESIEDVEKRVIPKLKEILNSYKGKTIILVAHGSVNKAIIGYFLNILYALRFKIKQSNCCVNEIDFTDNDFTVRFINSILF